MVMIRGAAPGSCFSRMGWPEDTPGAMHLSPGTRGKACGALPLVPGDSSPTTGSLAGARHQWNDITGGSMPQRTPSVATAFDASMRNVVWPGTTRLDVNWITW